MKGFASVALLAAVSQSVSGATIQKRADAIDDTTILNYALTLEHLESAFYKEALDKWDANAFTDAGFPRWVRYRFTEIADHEATHVTALSGALGDKAVQPCQYSFPYTDPKSFIALSSILEGVGTAAYTGAAMSITNKAYLTVAASILATEARHQSWVTASVSMKQPWTTAFETPLDFNEVYTLAAGFITSCPSGNPTLPFKAFPAVTLGSDAAPGKTGVSVTFDNSSSSDTRYVAFISGLDTSFVEIQDGKVDIPGTLQGTVFAVVTSNKTAVADSNIIAGPASLTFNFDSSYNQ